MQSAPLFVLLHEILGGAKSFQRVRFQCGIVEKIMTT